MNTPSPPKTSLKDQKVFVKISIFLFLLFSFLIIKFYKLQIVQHNRWKEEAEAQHFFTITEPFKRGRFYSNTSIKLGHPDTPQPFVIDVTKFHLHIDPRSIPEDFKDEIAAKLSTFLNLPEKNRSSYQNQFRKKSRNRKLAMWLDQDLKDLITQWWRGYAREHKIPRNALFFIKDYERSYPYGKLLGQLLHTIRDRKNEITKEGIPTGGLELHFNHLLKGRQGKRRLLRSPRHALETGNIIEYPQDGADIYLTINHYLQNIVEEELKRGVIRSNAKSGIAVMMNPYTGEIIALAHYPFFYPSDYQDYYNDPLKTSYVDAAAITSSYEPGSVMKAISAAIALKANAVLRERNEPPLFSPEEKVATKNGRFPGRSRPYKDGSVHNFLNMNMAIQKSSNIYFITLIRRVLERLGAEWYQEQLTDTFGFNHLTGIEFPAESVGKVPKPGRINPNGTLEWSATTPYSLAMGHSLQANALQIIRAMAVFGNGGYLVEPTLLRKIVGKNHTGEEELLLDNTAPERIKRFRKVLDSRICEQILTSMKYSTKWGGTSYRGDIPGYSETGKSGSSEKLVDGKYSKKLHFSDFVGFAPANKPRFVLFVGIDEPEHLFIPGIGKNHLGGVCAAPVFRDIGKRTLEYLGVTPDDPHGYPRGDPRSNFEKADWIVENRALRKLYDKWNK